MSITLGNRLGFQMVAHNGFSEIVRGYSILSRLDSDPERFQTLRVGTLNLFRDRR